MSRRRIAIGMVLLALAAGLAWWLRRGDAPPRARRAAVAENDPWAGDNAGDRALAAQKHAARGGAPADVTPGALGGHVRRAADGVGVAGAVVSVARREFAGALFAPAADEQLTAITDVDGAWAIAQVPPGSHVVSAAAADLLPASVDVVVAPRRARGDVDLALAAGGTPLTGTLTDIGGGPIALGRVTVRPTGLRVLDAAATYVAISDGDGRYRLTLPDDGWAATASHPDYAEVTRSVELRGQPRTLDFALTPGGVLRGQVVARDSGQPVAGARVVASGGHGRGRRGGGDDLGGGATTDADGRFALRGLGSGALEVTATARGYATPEPTVVELGIGEELADVVITVERAFTIAGFVVQDGGAGVPGVRVGVFSIAQGASAFALAPSAADGYFEVLGVRPAGYTVIAMGEDVMLEIGTPVTVTDHDVTDVIVTVDRGVTLSGRVTPGAAAALALEVDAAKVGLGNMFDVARAAMVHGASDASGAFTLRHVPPGTFTLVAQAADGRTGTLAVTVGAVDQPGLLVPLEARGAIAGRVVDVTGGPVAGVTVHARGSGGGLRLGIDHGPNETRTGADGRYRVAGLDPGEVTLSVSDDDGPLAFAGGADAAVTRTLAAAEELRDVTLTVEATDGVIRGVVLGLDRAPVADVWVTATATDSPWAAQLRATRARAEARADADQAGAQAGATDGVHVEVRVEDDAGGDDDDGPDLRGPGRTVLTGADGRFTLTRLRRGSYGLVAEATKGGVRAQRTGVQTGDTVTLTLERLGVLTGVVTHDGRPVATYDLACDGPGDERRRHVAAADGAYTLDRLPPGRYRCTATGDAGTAAGETTLVGGAGRLDLRLLGWASVTGVVVNEAGQPLAGLAVVVEGAGRDAGEAFGELMMGGGPRTDASGRFEIPRLAAGTAALMVMGQQAFEPLVTQTITLTADQRLDVGTITVRPAVPPPAPATP